MSTDSTILALRRFISRRRNPSGLYFDNGTNFHGADNELRRAWSEIHFGKMQDELSTNGTSWKFNPPLAPHMGGAWDRLVRSVKTTLKFILKERCPKEEVLHTVMCEAENTVNSRPLIHVSLDKDDPEALTPNHFLIGTAGNSTTPGVFSDDDLHLRKQWRFAQRLSDMFWKRWLHEYLPTLSKRNKWNVMAEPLELNDVVIIADDIAPRNRWPKGIIVAVHPGRDGQVRVADVKTVTGVCRRPATKLIKLNVRSN
ncbi:unnamed protein product [Allacma fusca]|uniref:Integrase catalytic domain-containing protein n=1 Tax=Allacma fusca TaxID=39272 RepID=A0A8J2JPI5_9HEXA|nr:unnamed protein product [Allacma fusca]